jgi:Protein of unknown function (DUF3140)
MDKDKGLIIEDFKRAVNMSPKQLENWLSTEDSQKVGQKNEETESIGHKSGKQIIELLHKQQSDYNDDDIAHMQSTFDRDKLENFH